MWDGTELFGLFEQSKVAVGIRGCPFTHSALDIRRSWPAAPSVGLGAVPRHLTSLIAETEQEEGIVQVKSIAVRLASWARTTFASDQILNETNFINTDHLHRLL
ncbi:hypothetical protein CQ018_14890 [Arthrobacter sp. MYb227]|nr:hypothetical protein CQ018_14890 [Arthrobacter sp. MYb227]